MHKKYHPLVKINTFHKNICTKQHSLHDVQYLEPYFSMFITKQVIIASNVNLIQNYITKISICIYYLSNVYYLKNKIIPDTICSFH